MAAPRSDAALQARLWQREAAYEQKRELTVVGRWGLGVDARWTDLRAAPDGPGARPGEPPRPFVAYLQRYAGPGGGSGEGPPVLLLHGASAWRGTFMEPAGGFIRHLLAARAGDQAGGHGVGYDVWTLDWRCSKSVTDVWKDAAIEEVPPAIRAMTLHDAALGELPAALQWIGEQRASSPRLPLVVGHCMGAAITALAIGEGHLGAAGSATPNPVAGVVLATLGLFYRTGVDTWFRANERLDRQAAQGSAWYVHPGLGPWPPELEEMFQVWRKTPYPACAIPFCQRLSCLLGAPYRPDDIGYLHDQLAEDDRDRPIAGLAGQFGLMPLSFLYHCAENVRRGWVAPRNAPAWDESALRADRFAGLDLLLVTGSENQLWYRDSIDRMYEWLRREAPAAARVKKKVFDRFGHQDLWWSPRAAAPGGVYEWVRRHLNVCSQRG